MNVDYRTLKKWANNFGIKTFGKRRWEIEELVLEAIEYHEDNAGTLHTITQRQARWYLWMNSDVPDEDGPIDEEPKRPRIRLIPKCNFCGKSEEEVDTMITGPSSYICNECIEIAQEMLVESQGKPEEKPPSLYCGGLYRRKLRIRK